MPRQRPGSISAIVSQFVDQLSVALEEALGSGARGGAGRRWRRNAARSRTSPWSPSWAGSTTRASPQEAPDPILSRARLQESRGAGVRHGLRGPQGAAQGPNQEVPAGAPRREGKGEGKIPRLASQTGRSFRVPRRNGGRGRGATSAHT